MPEYTREMASRAQMRHEARSADERCTLLRAMLVSAAGDTEPVYKGVDPDSGPFEGPELWEWALEAFGYFLQRHQPITLIQAAVRRGYDRAAEHEAMAERYYRAKDHG